MKSFVFALLIVAVAANPILQTEDVGEEFVPKPEGWEDWQLVEDTNGFMHLVDINGVDMDVGPAFNAPQDVIFHLFTRQNPTSPQNIGLRNSAQLASSNFVASRQTRFYAHGWGAADQNAGGDVRAAFIQQMDCNVFIVNWSAGSNTPGVITARNRINDVGIVVADFMNWINSLGTPFTNIIAVGHSLGGHVAAAAAKRTNALIRAVIGLCPAGGAMFPINDPANRIHHTDANYVEMILTDSGGMGMVDPVAHGNFYVNWGTNQPGCGGNGGCGHGRVIALYAASINSANIFGATRCSGHPAIQNRSCPAAGPSGRMGGDPPENSGPLQAGTVFYLPTTGIHPFAQGPR